MYARNERLHVLLRHGSMKGGGTTTSLSVHMLETEQALIGSSTLFRQILHVINTVAVTDCVVLLEGESGTGKELLARRIHLISPRASGPFIPVNCPGISETLFESQFYGHMKGSFTGASTDTLGIVRAAESGTLMLDEVGELDIHLQPKLLRILQEREVTPVGATSPIPVNVRFVAATNRSLAKAVLEGTFRSDLYHRLNVVRIQIPPLRSRPEDIEPLLRHYLDHYARQYRMTPRVFGQSLLRTLQEYPWPGNVRELAAYVERLYATNLPPMPPESAQWDDGHFAHPMPAGINPPADRMPLIQSSPPCCTLAQAEAQAIQRALETAGHNRSEAARILSIHRSTLLRKIRLLGLDS